MDASGAQQCWADYYPFGEAAGGTGCAGENYQFAGLYTDATGEDGGDSAAHRRYKDIYGRWFSPDPAGVKIVSLSDLQTWNMYAYVNNNPVTFNDPSGLVTVFEEQTNVPDADRGKPYDNCAVKPCDAEDTRTHAKNETVSTDHKQTQGQDPSQETLYAMGMGRKGGKGGGQGKGERRRTSKPENPGKHARWDSEKKRWWVKDPQTGKKVYKPTGWSPETAQRVGIGASIAAGAAVIVRVGVAVGRAAAAAAEACVESGACEAIP